MYEDWAWDLETPGMAVGLSMFPQLCLLPFLSHRVCCSCLAAYGLSLPLPGHSHPAQSHSHTVSRSSPAVLVSVFLEGRPQQHHLELDNGSWLVHL